MKGRSRPFFLNKSTTNRTGACVRCCHCSASNSSAWHSKAQQQSSGSGTWMSPCSRALMRRPPTLCKQPANRSREPHERAVAGKHSWPLHSSGLGQEWPKIKRPSSSGWTPRSVCKREAASGSSRSFKLDGVKDSHRRAVLIDKEVRTELHIGRTDCLARLGFAGLHGFGSPVGSSGLLVGSNRHWHARRGRKLRKGSPFVIRELIDEEGGTI